MISGVNGPSKTTLCISQWKLSAKYSLIYTAQVIVSEPNHKNPQ